MAPPLLTFAQWERARQRAERLQANPRDASLLAYARKAVNPEEHVEQRWLIERLSMCVSRIPELELLFAIPNGGARSKRTAGRLKAEGVKPAIPDLMWPVARGTYHGLFVEMKRIDGHARPDQREMQEKLRGQGYWVLTCQGADAAFQAVMHYWSLGAFTSAPT
jgi:hypothetical protein